MVKSDSIMYTYYTLFGERTREPNLTKIGSSAHPWQSVVWEMKMC